MKFSASITIQYNNIFSPFPAASWQEGFRWVREQGFDAVEVILADPKLLDVEALRAALSSCGLPVSTVSTGQAMAMEGLSMCAASSEVREATFRRLCEDLDFSAQIGKPNVTVGLIRGTGGKLERETEYELLLGEMRRVVQYAEKTGVRINFEPINRYECKLCNSTAEGRQLLQALGDPPAAGILYDTFHSNIEDADMLAAIRENAGHISHVHLADSNRHLPGEGHIDFPAVLRTLEQAGYAGYASLEVLNLPSAEHIREAAGSRIRKLCGGI